MAKKKAPKKKHVNKYAGTSELRETLRRAAGDAGVSQTIVEKFYKTGSPQSAGLTDKQTAAVIEAVGGGAAWDALRRD